MTKNDFLKYCILMGMILFFILSISAQNSYDPLLNKLQESISKSSQYDTRKLDKIKKIKSALSSARKTDLFDGYLNLYDEYRVFNYDSAYTYAAKMQLFARQQNDSFRIAYSQIKLSFILLSSGMFKEVFDAVKSIDLSQLTEKEKAEYYTLMARSYYDLADYDKDNIYTPEYDAKGKNYIDSALNYYSNNSFSFLYYSGLKNIRSGNVDSAFLFLNQILQSPSLSPHEIALTTSTLSDIFIRKGETDTAIHLLLQAAISDIESSTKETSASLNLATLLFKKNDFKNASTFIEKAVNDALFYGARQRKVQLSAILPLIEAEKINIVQKEKHLLLNYSIIITLFVVLLGFLIVIIYRQNKKLKNAKRIISQAHLEQQRINQRLLEANKIKEEYIGYFFSGNSDFHSRIERFKKLVEQKINDRKPDEIRFLVNNLNLKQERDELLKNFDQIFLNIFPGFIDKFNSFFPEDEKIKLKDGELLNTDLRIFALIRMGIHDNEKIASILGYSVNTINTYKTKIKNKSIIANEDFEQKIMETNI